MSLDISFQLHEREVSIITLYAVFPVPIFKLWQRLDLRISSRMHDNPIRGTILIWVPATDIPVTALEDLSFYLTIPASCYSLIRRRFDVLANIPVTWSRSTYLSTYRDTHIDSFISTDAITYTKGTKWLTACFVCVIAYMFCSRLYKYAKLFHGL
jgi:hypothetical protein